MSRPKSPARAPFAALAERLGVDLNAPSPEPEPITGPLLGGCDRFHAVEGCSGSFRLVDQSGPVWTAACDRCRAETTVSAKAVDPQVRRDALLARAGLPDTFDAAPFVRDVDNAPALDALRQWLAAFDGSANRAERPGTLLPAPCLYGLQGRGKSHLLTVTCRRVIEECELAVAFTSTRSLLADLQRFDNDVIRGAAWNRATTVDLLAVDDLGAERTTDWRLEQLAQLVDERYQRQLPILIATNYQPSEWEQVLDARTVSRLRQMTFPLELKGSDRRLRQSQSEEAA